MKHFIVCLALLTTSTAVYADMYSCAKMVYKDGWLRKYEYLGNTWGANTKKNGVTTSLGGSSIEKTTSSLDPGVTTGNVMSSAQYSSSWGECSMMNYHITRNTREKYIEQNMGDIIKQVAMGDGHHVDTLAFVSGCREIDRDVWRRSLQSRTAELYDAKTGAAFSEQLQVVIDREPSLKTNCQMVTI